MLTRQTDNKRTTFIRWKKIAERKIEENLEKPRDLNKIVPESSTSTIFQEDLPQTFEVACQTKHMIFENKATQVSLDFRKEYGTTSPFPIPFVIPGRPREEIRKKSDTSVVYYPSHRSQSSSSDTDLVKKITKPRLKCYFKKIIEKNIRRYTGIPKIFIEFKWISFKKYSIYPILFKIKSNESFARITALFGISKNYASDVFARGKIS